MGLQAGSSVTVHMPFEISRSSTPTTMEYNDMSSLSTVTFLNPFPISFYPHFLVFLS